MSKILLSPIILKDSSSEAVVFNQKISSETISSLGSILGYNIGLHSEGKHIFIPFSGKGISIALHMSYEERIEFIKLLEEIVLEENNV